MTDEPVQLPDDLFIEESPPIEGVHWATDSIVINEEDLVDEEIIVITEKDLPPEPTSSPDPNPDEPPDICCPYCQNKFTSEDEIVACDTCGSPHHINCWNEINKCSALNCPGRHYGMYIRSSSPEII